MLVDPQLTGYLKMDEILTCKYLTGNLGKYGEFQQINFLVP